MKPLYDYLERTLISPYISDRNATEPRDTIPATCRASISLYISATTIAEGAVRLFYWLMNFTLNTTICGVSDLCIVNGRCFFDLLFDDSKCVHLFLLKWVINLLIFRWIRFPVPSVVCVPVVSTFWYRILDGFHQFNLNSRFNMFLCFDSED